MPAESQVPVGQRPEFRRLCAAVKAFEAGADGDGIRRHGISPDRARRTYERAVTINPNTGTVYGFFACIPGRRFHTRGQERRKPFDPKFTARGRGWKLALKTLFKQHPKVLAHLTEFVLTRRLRLSDDKDAPVEPYAEVGPSEAHKAFVSLCVWVGVPANEWPLCAERQGESAIYDWFAEMRAAYPVETARNEHGDDAAAKVKVDLKAAGGNVVKPPRKRAYQEVQLDEHHVDGLYSVMYPGPQGLWVVVEYLRIWFLALVESLNGTILSSLVTYGNSFNTDDLFKLFRRAIWPLPPYKLSFNTPAYGYRKGACYPGNLPELRGLTFQVVKFDRHSTHTTAMQRGALEEVFKCEFKPGTVAHPMQQNMVENTFGILERMTGGLPNTTGKHPTDPVRRDPEGAAKRLKLTPLFAGEVFDVAARNHNASVHTGNLTRVDELLQWKLNHDMFVSHLEDYGPHNGHLLLPAIPVFASRTNGSTGPFGVNLDYGRYSSKELRSCAELEAANDWSGLLYPQEDARKAFFTASVVKDRVFALDLLGAWSEVPHSLQCRREIGAMRNNLKRYENVSNTRAMMELTSALGIKAANGDAAATTLLSQITNQMGEISLGRYGLVPTAGSEPPPPLMPGPQAPGPQPPAREHLEPVSDEEEAQELRRLVEEGAAGRSLTRAPDDEPGRQRGQLPAANEPFDSVDPLASAAPERTESRPAARTKKDLQPTSNPWGFDI
jgi:hypothetical protein